MLLSKSSICREPLKSCFCWTYLPNHPSVVAAAFSLLPLPTYFLVWGWLHFSTLMKYAPGSSWFSWHVLTVRWGIELPEPFPYVWSFGESLSVVAPRTLLNCWVEVFPYSGWDCIFVSLISLRVDHNFNFQWVDWYPLSHNEIIKLILVNVITENNEKVRNRTCRKWKCRLMCPTNWLSCIPSRLIVVRNIRISKNLIH